MSPNTIYYMPFDLLKAAELGTNRCKKFVVPAYLDLYNNSNNDGECYYTLFWLLTRGGGFESPSGTYGQDIYRQLKEAVNFLQQKNLIGDIVDCKTGEVIDIMTAKPRDLLCFDVRNLYGYLKTRFASISHEDYVKIKNIEYTERGFTFWKTLVMYMYISSCLKYNPRTNECAQQYWTFTAAHTYDDLCEGFTPTTVQSLFALLKENKLIEYETTYIKDSPEKPPRCIGKVTILPMGDDQDRVEYRLQQAKKQARIDCIRYESNKLIV